MRDIKINTLSLLDSLTLTYVSMLCTNQCRLGKGAIATCPTKQNRMNVTILLLGTLRSAQSTYPLRVEMDKCLEELSYGL